MADFNKAELIYDALYGMESKDDPMLSSIISTAKKLKTAEKTEYDNPEQKKAAIEKITGLLCERLGLVATDVFIVMNEPPLENWGMGGVQK